MFIDKYYYIVKLLKELYFRIFNVYFLFILIDKSIKFIFFLNYGFLY